MEEFVEEFFDELDFPVIVTDESDLVIYKNPFAKKYVPVPRKGGSIVRYVNSAEINVLDVDRLVSFSSLFGPSAPYRRAVVFKSDDSAAPARKLWIFDASLFLIQRDHIRGFLAGVNKSLAPTLIPLIKDDNGIKYLPRAAELSETMRILFKHFILRSRELEAAASFSRLCPADRLVDFLKSAVLEPTEKFGCPILFRYERGMTAPRYIDFTRQVLIFLRLFVMALERSENRSADVLIRCDDAEFSTLISYSPRLPKRYAPSGKFEEFRTIMPGDEINVAMLEALFEEKDGCKFSFEIAPDKTYPVTARFDMPLVTLPHRLSQDPGYDEGVRLEDIEEPVRGFLSAIIEK